MDFLPLPNDNCNHELVPDLGGPDYDNGGFKGYDTRQGWQIDKLRKGDVINAREEWNYYSQVCLKDVPEDQLPESGEDLIKAVIGPFIQTWLFFGLFHEALNRPILRSECSLARFDHDGSQKKYLTAQKLFTEFALRKDLIKSDAVWCKRFSSYLREAAWILEDLDTLSLALGGFIIPGIVHLALGTLVNTLDDYSVIWCQPHIRAANASVGRCRWFEQRLLERDWCPHMIRRVRTDLGIEGLYFASLLDIIMDDRRHDTCSEPACIAYNIGKDEEYKVWHSPEYCRCKDQKCSHTGAGCLCVKPRNMDTALQEVSAIIQSGQIPLISILKYDDSLEIQFIPFQQGIKYAAISHVWSDGMGNPIENSLSSCQIQALHDVVDRALHRSSSSEESYFWMDTICIPLVPLSIRATAIRTLQQIYADADCVIVLSRELWSIPLPKTLDEVLVRIFRSKWMTRLWTLQEGALAATLMFQFADHAVDYNYLDDSIVAANLDILTTSRLVGNRANLSLSSITSILSRGSSDANSQENRLKIYSSLWNALRHRSTSRISDIAICGAILLGIDLRSILDSPNDKKMEIFWISQHQIPSGILWVNGPRIDKDTLRWAPVSLLDARTWALSLPNKGPWATRTSEGLTFQGIEGFWLLDTPVPDLKDSIIEFFDMRTQKTYYISRMHNVGNHEWQELAEHWSKCALLWLEAPTQDTFSAGVLVSCSRIKAEIYHARWLAQVSVFVKGGDWDSSMLEDFSDFVDGGLARGAIPTTIVPSVEFIGDGQRWCLW